MVILFEMHRLFRTEGVWRVLGTKNLKGLESSILKYYSPILPAGTVENNKKAQVTWSLGTSCMRVRHTYCSAVLVFEMCRSSHAVRVEALNC